MAGVQDLNPKGFNTPPNIDLADRSTEASFYIQLDTTIEPAVSDTEPAPHRVSCKFRILSLRLLHFNSYQHGDYIRRIQQMFSSTESQNLKCDLSRRNQ